MPNLLPAAWSDVDAAELRFILLEVIGRPGQYDDRDRNPGVFHLPRARDDCQVSLTFDDKQIVGIEPGPAFDPMISQRSNTSIWSAMAPSFGSLARA